MKLDKCLSKVVQLEVVSDEDEESNIVQGHKNELEELNKEKAVIIQYIQQQAQKARQDEVVENCMYMLQMLILHIKKTCFILFFKIVIVMTFEDQFIFLVLNT